MNVTDSNKHILALNRIAEGVTMLAATIEETAWEGFEDHAGMPGARPIAAAQLAQPDLEQAAAEYGATHRQAPEPEPVSLAHVRGVLVEAERNPQLMLYALDALRTFGDLYDIETVAVTIYQPRRGNVDTWETSVADLEAWAETEVKPKAELAAAGGGLRALAGGEPGQALGWFQARRRTVCPQVHGRERRRRSG